MNAVGSVYAHVRGQYRTAESHFSFRDVFGGLLHRRKLVPKARCHAAFRLDLD